MALETCPDCGRSKDSSWCGYCWGLEVGAAYHEEQYKAFQEANAPQGKGCAVVVLAMAALPALLAVAGVLTAYHNS